MHGDDLAHYKAQGRFLDGYPPEKLSEEQVLGPDEPRQIAGLGLTLSRNAVVASEMRAVLDLNHDWMLKQMAEERAKRK